MEDAMPTAYTEPPNSEGADTAMGTWAKDDIRLLRKHIGLDQQRFGEMLGYSPERAQVSVSNLERGVRNPGGAVERLLDILAAVHRLKPPGRAGREGGMNEVDPKQQGKDLRRTLAAVRRATRAFESALRMGDYDSAVHYAEHIEQRGIDLRFILGGAFYEEEYEDRRKANKQQ